MSTDASGASPPAAVRGRWFDELHVGEAFGSAVTITETHLVLSAGLLADFNPLHVDEEFARKSRFGGRILHGMMTSAIMGGPVGMHFHGTAMAYLEHNARFRAPVRPGDTLTIAWTIDALVPKPRHGGGIAQMTGSATNQHGEVAAQATGKIMVFARPHSGSAAAFGVRAVISGLLRQRHFPHRQCGRIRGQSGNFRLAPAAPFPPPPMPKITALTPKRVDTGSAISRTVNAENYRSDPDQGLRSASTHSATSAGPR